MPLNLKCCQEISSIFGHPVFENDPLKYPKVPNEDYRKTIVLNRKISKIREFES